MRLAWILLIAACYRDAAHPPPRTCRAVADHVAGLIAPARTAVVVRGVVADRCEADGWGDDARACMLATTSLRAPRRCKALLTGAQLAALDRALAEPTPPAASPSAPICGGYRALIARLQTCKAVPPARRAELGADLRTLIERRRAEGRAPATIEAECKVMEDALRQVLVPMCRW